MTDSNVKQAHFSNSHVVLLVEDHEIVRHGEREIIASLLAEEGGVEILEASTFSEANQIVLARGRHIELVILDLSLPDATALQMLDCLETSWVDLPVVVVSATEDWGLVARFLQAGVLGFVPKSSNMVMMTNALQIVFSGGHYFPTQVSLALAEKSVGVANQSAIAEMAHENIESYSHPVRLSPRQEEILCCMFKGLSNKEIARTLELSLGTVKNYVASILLAFNVNSRSSAVMAAIRSGYEGPQS